MTALRLGTRASLLALTQATMIADALRKAGVEVELVPMASDGDNSSASLLSLGGTGIFAAALRQALLAGECDAVVHSFKDLPTAPEPGLQIVAIPERADHRDALCAATPLAELRQGARVGTGSPRRRAQLLARRPDLEVVDVRGNVDTRIAMVATGKLDAVVLAAAGLVRIGREEMIVELFEWPTAPAQGALAIEAREGDEQIHTALRLLHHEPTAQAVSAERGFLGEFEAGCAAPIAASASIRGTRLEFDAVIYHADGTTRHGIRVDVPVGDAAVTGAKVARGLLDADVADGLT